MNEAAPNMGQSGLERKAGIHSEEWRDLIGYDGLYQVSSLGRVRTRPRLVRTLGNSSRLVRGQIIKASPALGGYLCFAAWKEGENRRFWLHREICRAFNGPPPSDDALCCHLDGNPLNNIPTNLVWGTPKLNAEHRGEHGRQPRGESSPHAKLTAQQVLEIRAARAKGVTCTSLAKRFGVRHQTILRAAAGVTWRDTL